MVYNLVSAMRLRSLYLFFSLTIASAAAAQPDPQSLDVRLFRSINNARSNFLTGVANITDYSVYPIVVLVPLGFVGYGFASSSVYEQETGILIGSTALLSTAIYAPLKLVFRQARPYMELPDVHAGHLETTSRYGFPSGHSSMAVSIATMITIRYPEPEIYIPVFAWALLAGYSRIYYGLHYPSDVLAGTAIGVGSALLVNHFGKHILSFTRTLFGQSGRNVHMMILPTLHADIRSASSDRGSSVGVTAALRIRF